MIANYLRTALSFVAIFCAASASAQTMKEQADQARARMDQDMAILESTAAGMEQGIQAVQSHLEHQVSLGVPREQFDDVQEEINDIVADVNTALNNQNTGLPFAASLEDDGNAAYAAGNYQLARDKYAAASSALYNILAAISPLFDGDKQLQLTAWISSIANVYWWIHHSQQGDDQGDDQGQGQGQGQP